MIEISPEVVEDVSSFISSNIEEFISDAKSYGLLDEDNFENYGMELTFAISEDGCQWNWQSGDNSFTGGAYSLPHWAVVYVAEDTSAEELAAEVFGQWNDLLGY